MFYHGIAYSGTSLIRKCPPQKDRRRRLGMVVLKCPMGWQFLMSEVPLYSTTVLPTARFLNYRGTLLKTNCALPLGSP